MSQEDWVRLQYYSRKVKFFSGIMKDDLQVHPTTYNRIAQLLKSTSLFPSLRRFRYDLDLDVTHIFLFLSPLLDSLELFNFMGSENIIVGPFLAAISPQMLSRIVLCSGRMSGDILKKYIGHFKQLRSLELSYAIDMSDFTLWEVLGTLPSLANLTFSLNPELHPTPDPENSDSQCGGPKYFEALESLCVTGSLSLTQHLLGFIDSPCLKSIEVYLVPVFHNETTADPDSDDLFTTSMTIVDSKWSQSLKNLVIDSSFSGYYGISKCIMLFMVLHEMQTCHLTEWYIGNLQVDNDVRRLVMSWPKLRVLNLEQTLISLSTLMIIAENCPELRQLHIHLDTSTFPPFDTSSKSLRHNLEVLNVAEDPSSGSFTQSTLESQIQVSLHLDLNFPYLKAIVVQPEDVTWSAIRDLVKLCQVVRRVK